MKRIYLAISYSNRNLFDKEIESLKYFFKQNNIELFVFVDQYNFEQHQEHQMMQTAFREIENSEVLIAELTTKSIGVGIEIGYAYAKTKPIIYLRKQNSEYSTTASGSSNFSIEYQNEIDLIEKLEKAINQL